MIHYHGTPLTPIEALYNLAGRNFFVSHARPDDIRRVAAIARLTAINVSWADGCAEAQNATYAALDEVERLKSALEPFARFAKMFADEREHKQGHVPVEPNAKWYAHETKQGIYVLTPGMFDEANKAVLKASAGEAT